MDFFKHDIGEFEIEYIAKTIREGNITTGKVTKEFASILKVRFDFPNVALANSGTSALYLAMYALGIGPGDEVITTPYVGVWTPNAILMTGATPVFADICRDTYNLDPDSVAKKISSKTKAILPVSVNGVPCDLKGLKKVAPNIRIICDDIEALGSKRQGCYVGQDIGNDISVGGFWISKQVTTGCGGMVVSEDTNFIEKFEKLTRHGHGLVGNMWDQNFGFNLWLCDPLAAIGVVQVSRFDEKQYKLLEVKKMLDKYFSDYRKQVVRSGDFASEFIYLIELPVGINKKAYSDLMEEKGIPTRPYFNSLLDVPHLKQFDSYCPVNYEVSRRTIALPYHWKLTSEEVDKIVKAHFEVMDLYENSYSKSTS